MNVNGFGIFVIEPPNFNYVIGFWSNLHLSTAQAEISILFVPSQAETTMLPMSERCPVGEIKY